MDLTSYSNVGNSVGRRHRRGLDERTVDRSKPPLGQCVTLIRQILHPPLESIRHLLVDVLGLGTRHEVRPESTFGVASHCAQVLETVAGPVHRDRDSGQISGPFRVVSRPLHRRRQEPPRLVRFRPEPGPLKRFRGRVHDLLSMVIDPCHTLLKGKLAQSEAIGEMDGEPVRSANSQFLPLGEAQERPRKVVSLRLEDLRDRIGPSAMVELVGEVDRRGLKVAPGDGEPHRHRQSTADRT